jgi:hypothetical protein
MSNMLVRGFASWFSLMSVGISILVLGLQYAELGLAIFGGIFILTMVVASRGLGVWAQAGTLGGALCGALVGMLGGMLTREIAESPVGLVGGAILGAIAGLFLVEIVLGSLIPLPVELVLRAISAPRKDSAPSPIATALDVLGVILGAILGARGLSVSFLKLFGPIGGGAVAGGVLGMMVGAFAGVFPALGDEG